MRTLIVLIILMAGSLSAICQFTVPADSIRCFFVKTQGGKLFERSRPGYKDITFTIKGLKTEEDADYFASFFRSDKDVSGAAVSGPDSTGTRTFIATVNEKFTVKRFRKTLTLYLQIKNVWINEQRHPTVELETIFMKG